MKVFTFHVSFLPPPSSAPPLKAAYGTQFASGSPDYRELADSLGTGPEHCSELADFWGSDLNTVPDKMSDIECQIQCQIHCQIECQIKIVR